MDNQNRPQLWTAKLTFVPSVGSGSNGFSQLRQVDGRSIVGRSRRAEGIPPGGCSWRLAPASTPVLRGRAISQPPPPQLAASITFVLSDDGTNIKGASAPLTTKGRHIGALKVYSPLPLAFDDNSVFLIEHLASPAAVLLAHIRDRKAAQRMSAELAEALTSRDIISKAQGILIERMNLNSQEALEVLLARSRGESTPLHGVALEIVQQATSECKIHWTSSRIKKPARRAPGEP